MSYSLCGQSVANTGEVACDKAKGTLKKIFIFNGGIGPSDYATPEAFLTKLISNSKLSKTALNKVFPINEMQDIADSTEANTEGTLGLGFKMIIREGRPVFTCKIIAGADLQKRLRKFNNQTIRVVEYDDNGIFWGTKSGSNFVGYKAKLFFSGGKPGTGQNVEQGVVTFTISYLETTEYYDNSYWMEAEGNVNDIKGLLDVTMSVVSVAANVYKIDFKIAGASLKGPLDIWEAVGALIAALTFTAGSGVNYATSLPITSIAVDDVLKCATVTFDNTAHTAVPASSKFRLTPPTPAVLDAADVTDTEILPLIITKAA